MSFLLVVEEVSSSINWNAFFNNNYVVEIIGGLILSAFGMFLIWFLRPKVKISPKIAYEVDPETGENIYKIKIINKSIWFQLLDIKFELTKLVPTNGPKGTNLDIKHIDLVSNHIWFLSRRQGGIRKWFANKDSYATFCVIITVKENEMIENWRETNNGAFFDLKVIAKNNFSGITNIIHEKYSHKTSLKRGEFCHGDTFEIACED